MKKKNSLWQYIIIIFLLLLVVVSFSTEGNASSSQGISFFLYQTKSEFNVKEPININMVFESSNDVILYKHKSFGMKCYISYFLFFIIMHEDGEILKYYNSGFPLPLLPTKTDYVRINEGKKYQESFDLRKYYRYCPECKGIYLKKPEILKLKEGKYKVRAIYMNNSNISKFWQGSAVSNELNFTILKGN